jgi:hypothetical protein
MSREAKGVTQADIDYYMEMVLKRAREYALMKARGQSLGRDGTYSQHYASDAERLAQTLLNVLGQEAVYLFDIESRLGREAAQTARDNSAEIAALKERVAALERDPGFAGDNDNA